MLEVDFLIHIKTMASLLKKLRLFLGLLLTNISLPTFVLLLSLGGIMQLQLLPLLHILFPKA
jgi:hypothetical protein